MLDKQKFSIYFIVIEWFKLLKECYPEAGFTIKYSDEDEYFIINYTDFRLRHNHKFMDYINDTIFKYFYMNHDFIVVVEYDWNSYTQHIQIK